MKIKNIALAITMALSSVPAIAADFTTSGFFNGVITSDSDGDIDFDNKTKAGIQFDAKISDSIFGTLQAVTEVNEWNENVGREIVVEYGFLGYQINQQLTARVGRLKVPVFMNSEYLNVGAVVPWIEAPYSVYHQLPANSYDGADISFSHSVGEVDYTVQAFMGKAEREVNAGGLDTVANFKKMMGSNLTFNYADFQFRFAYAQADTSFMIESTTKMGMQQGVAQLNAGAQQYMAGATALASIDPTQSAALHQQAIALMTQAGSIQFVLDEMPKEETISFYNIGISGYLTDNISVVSEIAYIDSSHKIEGDDVGFYLGAMYEFGNGFKIMETYSWRSEKTLNDTNEEITTEFITTLSYNISEAWTVKGEISIAEAELTVGSTAITEDKNRYGLSINYIF